MLVVARAGASRPDLPATVDEARSLLDSAEENLGVYRQDPEAAAAAPDAIRQAGEAIAAARALLAEGGIERAAWAFRRATTLVGLIAELIEARMLEKAANTLADRAIEALERLAIARAAYDRIAEQLHLFAIPFPGEPGP